jgi:NADP-dependent 3-hydroxy acid dehydrogenase YdfG
MEMMAQLKIVTSTDHMSALFATLLQAQEKYEMVNKMKVLEPEDIARAVLYAVTQPEHCAVNEVLVEPREAPI